MVLLHQTSIPHVKQAVHFLLSWHYCLLRGAFWEYWAAVSMQQPIFLHWYTLTVLLLVSFWLEWVYIIFHLRFFSSANKFHYLLTIFCFFFFFFKQINCVTFPHPDIMPEQQLLKPSEWSYCDYFWVSRQPATCHIAALELLKKRNEKLALWYKVKKDLDWAAVVLGQCKRDWRSQWRSF